MQAGLLSVGSELLRGEVLDTNAHWLSQQLFELGISVARRITVPDKLEPIDAALRELVEAGVPLVLVVGGLGPTVDDLTRDGIASAAGLPLKLDEGVLDELRRRFQSFGYEMPEGNRRQAEFPEGAEILGNPWGTAPSFLTLVGETRIVAFPGVPREMKKIFERLLVPRIHEWFPDAVPLQRLTVRTFGIGESSLEDRVRDLIALLPEGTSWSSLPRERGNCDLVITVTQASATILAQSRELQLAVRERLGHYAFSVDPAEELDAIVHSMLLERRWTLALAESCTGGMVCERLSSHPGCSKYLERAIIAYSNRAKVEELGVLPETLEKHGAVSAEVALEMARGAREKAGTDIGAAITGIAGPGGGTAVKPVGLVYWAVVTPSKEISLTRTFPGDRQQIRSRSADALLDAIRRSLLEA